MIGDSDGNYFPTEFDFASGLFSQQFDFAPNDMSKDMGFYNIGEDNLSPSTGMARPEGLPYGGAMVDDPAMQRSWDIFGDAYHSEKNQMIDEMQAEGKSQREILDAQDNLRDEVLGRFNRRNDALDQQYGRMEGNPAADIGNAFGKRMDWDKFIGNQRPSENIDDSRESDMQHQMQDLIDKTPIYYFKDQIGDLINQEDFYKRAFEGQESLPIEAFQSVLGPNFDWEDFVRNQRPSTNIEDVRPTAFDTQLGNRQEEERFQEWKQKYAPNDSGVDYDLRGAFKAGIVPGENGHFTDQYKKPSHPTFSDQSIYSKGDLTGGKWEQDNEGKWTFTPSKTNLSYHSKEDIQNYLNASDPSVKLNVLPENVPSKEDITFHAMAANKNASVTDRSVFKDEIEKNPALIRKAATMVKGEVSLRDPVKARIQMESAFNRARIRGIPLSQALRAVNEGKGGYYARDTYRHPVSQKEMDWFMTNVWKPVMAGSDEGTKLLGSPVTGNASLMSFAGKRLAQGLYAAGKWYSGKPGVGEMFVTEKPDAVRLAKLGIPVQPTAVAGNVPLPRERPDIHLAEAAPETFKNHDPAEIAKSMEAIKNMITGGASVPIQSEEIKNAAESITKFLRDVNTEIDKGFGGSPTAKNDKVAANTKPGQSGTTAEKYLLNKEAHTMSPKDMEEVTKYLQSKGLDPSKLFNK